MSDIREKFPYYNDMIEDFKERYEKQVDEHVNNALRQILHNMELTLEQGFKSCTATLEAYGILTKRVEAKLFEFLSSRGYKTKIECDKNLKLKVEITFDDY